MASGGQFFVPQFFCKDNKMVFLVRFHHFSYHGGGSDFTIFSFTPPFSYRWSQVTSMFHVAGTLHRAIFKILLRSRKKVKEPSALQFYFRRFCGVSSMHDGTEHSIYPTSRELNSGITHTFAGQGEYYGRIFMSEETMAY